MGMFDTIGEELFCPFCGTKQEKDDFQTKDLSNFLSSWTFKEIRKCVTEKQEIRIYTHCRKCERWIEIALSIGYSKFKLANKLLEGGNQK